MIEPKIGEVITIDGVELEVMSGGSCKECYFRETDCPDVACCPMERRDSLYIILVKKGKESVEETLEKLDGANVSIKHPVPVERVTVKAEFCDVEGMKQVKYNPFMYDCDICGKKDLNHHEAFLTNEGKIACYSCFFGEEAAKKKLDMFNTLCSHLEVLTSNECDELDIEYARQVLKAARKL